jgi:predicted nucleic acid-binding protein
MICYLDSSIILRRLLGESNSYKPWGGWTEAYTSTLLRVEVFRTIDRLRISNILTDVEVARSVEGLHRILSHVGEVALSDAILKRASQSFSVTLGTLDALHCATAELLSSHLNQEVVLLTHDKQLGVAAQTIGLAVKGV